ncbi:MAG TPA: SDR family NAD(P)-dependent oxidoreductase [Chloroflexota bacterium]|nr:SDR family NAD(P)-dependent oxidoreductase [Chloroflexota bacterium]
MSTRRAALITGAANGIGAAVVARLAAAGHDLALFDCDAARLESVAGRAREMMAGRVHTYPVDVRESGPVTEAVAAAHEALGRLEILVNAVGGSTPQRPVEEISEEEWDAVLTLNLRGLFLCTRAVVPHMKAQRYGRIVNVSSVAGRTRSLFGGAHYTASKAGVIGFSRQCAAELAPFGVTVNVVAPGVTLSERVAARWEAKPAAERAFIESLIPAGRVAACDEPAAAIAFLCSEDASYISGTVVDVNGGLYIG